MKTLVTDHRQSGWAWHIDEDGEGRRAWCEAHRFLDSDDSDPLWRTVNATRVAGPPPEAMARLVRKARCWFARYSACDDLQLGLTLDSGQRWIAPFDGKNRNWQNLHRWQLAVSLRATLTGTTSLNLSFAQNHLPLDALLAWFGELQTAQPFEAISLQRFRTRYPRAAVTMAPWQWAPPLAASLEHLRRHPHPHARWHEPRGDDGEALSFSLADGLAQVRLLPNPVFSMSGRERWRFIAYDGHEHVLFISGRWQGVRQNLAVALSQPLHRYFQQFAFARDYHVLVLRGVLYRLPGVLWPGP